MDRLPTDDFRFREHLFWIEKTLVLF